MFFFNFFIHVIDWQIIKKKTRDRDIYISVQPTELFFCFYYIVLIFGLK